MDLNSKSFNWSIFNPGARYFALLERVFGTRMVHDTSIHQIFQALFIHIRTNERSMFKYEEDTK